MQTGILTAKDRADVSDGCVCHCSARGPCVHRVRVPDGAEAGYERAPIVHLGALASRCDQVLDQRGQGLVGQGLHEVAW